MNTRKTRSRTRMWGAWAVSATNVSVVTCSESQSKENWVTCAWATCNVAVSAAVFGSSPCKTNQAGVKIAGLKFPRSTTATPSISGCVLTLCPLLVCSGELPSRTEGGVTQYRSRRRSAGCARRSPASGLRRSPRPRRCRRGCQRVGGRCRISLGSSCLRESERRSRYCNWRLATGKRSSVADASVSDPISAICHGHAVRVTPTCAMRRLGVTVREAPAHRGEQARSGIPRSSTSITAG